MKGHKKVENGDEEVRRVLTFGGKVRALAVFGQAGSCVFATACLKVFDHLV